MAISLNPSFKQDQSTLQKFQQPPAGANLSTVETPVPRPNFVSEPSQKPEKSATTKAVNAWVNTSEFIKGTIGGIFSGAIMGTIVAAVDLIYSGVSKRVTWAEIFKTPVKMLSKTGKYLAPAVAAVVFVDHLINARLKAKQRTAKN